MDLSGFQVHGGVLRRRGAADAKLILFMVEAASMAAAEEASSKVSVNGELMSGLPGVSLLDNAV